MRIAHFKRGRTEPSDTSWLDTRYLAFNAYQESRDSIYGQQQRRPSIVLGTTGLTNSTRPTRQELSATVAGTCYDGKENPPRPPATNLDHVPLPNLSLIDVRNFAGADPQIGYPSMFIMGSRGCPFKCTFCNKSIWGNHVRFRRPEALVDEIEWLHNQYGIREVFFQDDTFNLRREWAEEVFHLIIDRKLNKKLTYKTPFRANEKLVDADLLRLARKAGFWLLFYGVENGNQEMLDAMGKGLKIDELRRAFRLTHEAGIATTGSFMLGMPGETEATVQDTIKLWGELRPFVTGFGPAIPFPATEFDQTVTEKGHKLITDYDDFTPNAIHVRTDELDGKRLENLLKNIKKLIIRRFVIDLLKLRYLRVLIFGLRSPWYLYHVARRIFRYLGL